MATEVIKTIKSSGGDYTTLHAFKAGEVRDLVAADEIAVAEVYYDVDFNYLDFRAGWTTDAAHRIIIRCPTDNGNYDSNYYHAGIPGAGVTIDQNNGGYGIIPTANMTIAGLEITQTSASQNIFAGASTGPTIRSTALLVHDFRGLTEYNEYAINCVFYNGYSSTGGAGTILRNGAAVNCSVYADDWGGYNGTIIFRDATCYNCAIYHATVNSGYGHFYGCSGDYNACSDISAPGSHSFDNISDPFKNSANNDFSIGYSSALKDTGTDFSTYLSEDISGTSRPQGDYWDIGAWEYVSSGGIIVSIDAAWKIFAKETVNTSWRLFDLKNQSAAWKIKKELIAGSAWKIMKSGVVDTAWKMFADTSLSAVWRIFTSKATHASWKIFKRLISGYSWAVINRLSQDTAWQILNQGTLSQDLAWKILVQETKGTAWKILTEKDLVASWKIFNGENVSTVWRILTSGEINQAIAWKIKNMASKIIGWKIQAAKSMDAAWKIINEKDQALAWNILKVTDKAMAYKIFAELGKDTSWVLGDADTDIPQVVYELFQPKRDFIFNAKKRTFIFYQKER